MKLPLVGEKRDEGGQSDGVADKGKDTAQVFQGDCGGFAGIDASQNGSCLGLAGVVVKR